ncbi:FKBP-type peptidyl-prolyl cis-trans isomerase [Sphingomonas sp.]|jgi:FKBP-type peptidyl-prolyl cis-trans isomerase FkpA|uniref:FKBP-type peptidyl-prolyl cis-trans isomerase n=1 Tax=Sphingomonas sp. TaxID=28214 RepID=UPI00286DE13C|nr:FKBP-type peptidyl-prolyl cis-trans isomerase [Sphingomonas sp.]
MSVAEAAHRPAVRGRSVKIWLAFLALIAAGVLLAWIGAGSLRGETTPSGLKFRTIAAGTGPQVKAVDGVLIEYEGRLADGTVFDSSEGRGPTPMIAGQVIPGFAEALTKMQKGGRYQVRIPAALGYGASPPPGSPIPANADLEFDVHVVQVVPNAALMQGATPAQPQ